ncbi:unnamed protein product [Adineta steineri]|uniref:Tetratricopeptide repeat protein n=1 Tax=Adineta steineri TaxID=433720 RepID=A0A819RND4_9BILA|nr:unnamed protein product [Adineta steineri]CAF4047752.1 unnamed protein product [Adineta steineri]
MLATKSLMSARTISRRNTDIGLTSVLFEIQITQRTNLFDFHEDNCLLFPVASTFRICSVDQGPDGVWYVKMSYTSEPDLEIVIQQLQYEVKEPLNWLTFGHYLCCLKLVDEAKEYYSFWLRTLAEDHPDIFSIHHHFGLLYAEIKEVSKALHHMNKVVQCPQFILEEGAPHEQYFAKIQESYRTSINQSLIFGTIADLHDQIGEHKKALDCYEKAFTTTTDQRCRRQFEYKYSILKNMLEPCVSSNFCD